MADIKKCLCIDVGGTAIKHGVIDSDRALVSSDSIDEYNIFINYCGDYPYIEHIGKENNEKSVFCQNSIH